MNEGERGAEGWRQLRGGGEERKVTPLHPHTTSLIHHLLPSSLHKGHFAIVHPSSLHPVPCSQIPQPLQPFTTPLLTPLRSSLPQFTPSPPLFLPPPVPRYIRLITIIYLAPSPASRICTLFTESLWGRAAAFWRRNMQSSWAMFRAARREGSVTINCVLLRRE